MCDIRDYSTTPDRRCRKQCSQHRAKQKPDYVNKTAAVNLLNILLFNSQKQCLKFHKFLFNLFHFYFVYVDTILFQRPLKDKRN